MELLTSSEATCSGANSRPSSVRELSPDNASQHSGSPSPSQAQPGRDSYPADVPSGAAAAAAAKERSSLPNGDAQRSCLSLFTAPGSFTASAAEPGAQLASRAQAASQAARPPALHAPGQEPGLPQPVRAAPSPVEDEPAPLPAQRPREGPAASAPQASAVSRLRRDAATTLAVLLEDDECKLQVQPGPAC